MPKFEFTSKMVGNGTEVVTGDQGNMSLYLSAEDAESLVEYPWSTEAIDLTEQVKQAYHDAKVQSRAYTGIAYMGGTPVYDVTVEKGADMVKVERRPGFGPYADERLAGSLADALREAQAVIEYNAEARR